MTNRQFNTIEGFKYKIKIPIRFADIDAFGHVNNAIYLTYFEIARSSYWDEIIEWNWNELGIIIRQSLVDYLKPIHLNDEIYAYVKTSRIGNSSFDLDYILVKIIDGREEICTSGQTICVTFDYKSKLSAPIPEKQRNKMIGN
jgi:acyl-CoA thioester hydrolase